MRVTIKDIARSAGVSYSTVSKALRNSPLVKEPTKQKIMAIAKEIGYQPNVAARTLVSKKTKTIGIIWPTVERAAHSALITEMTKRLEKEGYSTLVSINDETSAVQIFNQFHVDAILLFDEKEVSPALAPASPLICYGRAAGQPVYPTVDANRQQAIRLAVEHLRRLGHRKISFMGDLTGREPVQEDKQIGFRKGMDSEFSTGFSHFFVPVAELEQYDGYLAAKSLFQTENRPTAIISSSYELTRGIVRAAEECCIAIPDDLSLIGYDLVPHQQLSLPVSAVGVPVGVLTAKLTTVLLEAMEGRILSRKIVLEPELQLASSCQPPGR